MLKGYEPIRKIGQGAFGSVFLVKKESIDDNNQQIQLYAMKNIPLDKIHVDIQAQILPKLHHPNIISTKEIIFNGLETILILEYASQGDLNSYIKQNCLKNYIQTKIVVGWLLQLCLALHYIHSQFRIIHRDVKSKNVLIMKNGLLKLADFGVCRKLEKGQEFAATSVGTPQCLSPQIIDLGKYDTKTDVWGLGCIMFELCTGTKPFHAPVLSQLIKNIMDNDCGEIPQIYPKWLQETIRSMLQKQPDKRPSIQKILQKQQLKDKFQELKQQYKEQYKNVMYPIQEIRTSKHLQKDDKMLKIFSQSLKTAKNEKYHKRGIDYQQTNKKDNSIIMLNSSTSLHYTHNNSLNHHKKVQRDKFLDRSLKNIVINNLKPSNNFE